MSLGGCPGVGQVYAQLQEMLLNGFPKEDCSRGPPSSPALGVTSLPVLGALLGFSGVSVCISLVASKALGEELVQVSTPVFPRTPLQV